MKSEILKQLQCLYSWKEFYAKNQLWSQMDKCAIQIDEFKKKHNIA